MSAMSDEYCYRDARLSIWQAAVGEVQLKYNQPAGKVANASLTAKPVSWSRWTN